MLHEPTIHKAVEFAIVTEEIGARVYTQLAEKFAEHEEISEGLSLLAADERMHGSQFKALLGKLPPDENVTTGDEEHQHLRAMAMSGFFDGGHGLAAMLEKVQSIDQALEHVFGFEKATLGFYRAIHDILGQNEILDGIIRAEKQHIARVMKYIITSAKFRGLADDY
jgi:rubrerythrin